MPSRDEISNSEGRPATEEDFDATNPTGAPPGAVIIADEDENILPQTPLSARSEIPKQVAEAINLIRWSLIDNTSCKNMLRAVKVSGLLNAKLSRKIRAIALKMVQRGFCINTAFELTENTDNGSNVLSLAAHALSQIPPTTVKVVNESRGAEGIPWSRRDIPV